MVTAATQCTVKQTHTRGAMDLFYKPLMLLHFFCVSISSRAFQHIHVTDNSAHARTHTHKITSKTEMFKSLNCGYLDFVLLPLQPFVVFPRFISCLPLLTDRTVLIMTFLHTVFIFKKKLPLRTKIILNTHVVLYLTPAEEEKSQ